MNHWLNGFDIILQERRLKPATLRTYTAVLADFDRYVMAHSLRQQPDPHQIAELTRSYLAEVTAKRDLKPGSINQMITLLNALATHLQLPGSRLSRVPTPYFPAPKILSDGDTECWLNAAVKLPDARDRCLVLLLALTALRPAECCGLDTAHVSQGATEITITGSRKYPSRLVLLTPEVQKSMLEWLTQREQRHAGCSEQAVFLTRNGRRLNHYSLDQIVRKTAVKARIPVNARILRDTFLTRLASSGVPSDLLKVLSGHTDLRVTQRYY
jgi:integrase